MSGEIELDLKRFLGRLQILNVGEYVSLEKFIITIYRDKYKEDDTFLTQCCRFITGDTNYKKFIKFYSHRGIKENELLSMIISFKEFLDVYIRHHIPVDAYNIRSEGMALEGNTRYLVKIIYDLPEYEDGKNINHKD